MSSFINRQCYRSIHSSASLSGARLVKSLKPRRGSGKFEVAPKDARPRKPIIEREKFVRDDVPHSGRVPTEELERKRRETFLARKSEPTSRGGERFRDRDTPAPRSRERDFSARPREREFSFTDRRDRDGGAPRTRDRDFTPPSRTRERDFEPRSTSSPQATSSRPFDTLKSTTASVVGTKQLYDNKPSTSSLTYSKPQKSEPLDLEQASSSAEFYTPPSPVTRVADPKAKSKQPSSLDDASTKLPSNFTSPPILPEFVQSLREALGPDARPTPIQALSIKWLLENRHSDTQYRQFLLAAETGSGKSIAYLLPVLQHLKEGELTGSNSSAPVPSKRSKETPRPHNPRVLVLAPTHELSRQLSGFAKSLLHHAKLRVACASQANVKSTKGRDARASQMAADLAAFDRGLEGSELGVKKEAFPVDVMIGTPMKVLEMIRGRGWDRKTVNANEEAEEDEDMGMEDPESDPGMKLRRGRDQLVGYGAWRSKPELGLGNVEWVVIDEADVLLDPDFQESTRTLLADIAAARGKPVPDSPTNPFSASTPYKTLPPSITDSLPLNYPFNLILTSATIPTKLNKYLETHHPSLIRLASPRLHHLPKKLTTEYVSWTGGNKFADVEKRLRKVWAEDAVHSHKLSKVLVFCNKSAKVIELSNYFEERGIKTLPMTSGSEHRGRGSNKHLGGFLKAKDEKDTSTKEDGHTQQGISPTDAAAAAASIKSNPHVLVTTSLLSRGLDFSPDIKHVFIVDEPRNMVDFIHRAGRSGRAGKAGRVVVFGKGKGRGSEGAKEVRRKVGQLTRN